MRGLLLVLVMAVGGAEVLSQEGKGTIEGRILLAGTEEGIAGVQVTLQGVTVGPDGVIAATLTVIPERR